MTNKRHFILTVFMIFAGSALLGLLVLSRWPGLGAQMAKPLRGIIGKEGVAQLETIFFTVQDNTTQLKFQAGLEEAEAPWQVTAVATPTTIPPTNPPIPSATPAAHTPDPNIITPVTATIAPTDTPQPTFTATPSQWHLPNVTPFADLTGEGVWQPYLFNEAGEALALRTFLQPDPQRPYAIAAIVAFDLEKIQLHYVLGSEEPALPDGPRGSGYLQEADKQPGHLLATFNGGFMASHGQYGAMAAGFVALPPKNGYATITMGNDGRVQIGEWGNDIATNGDYQSWRQNARLITQDGLINERVYNGSAATWGSSINGDIVTWRSGLGINEAETVLYFVAGPSLSMPSLAAAMTTVNAHNSMLLDINETWVHFAAIQAIGEQLHADPLLPDGMDSNPDRYLKQSQRDFFYITVRPSS